MKVRGLLIDVKSNPGKVKKFEIEEENLQEFYDALDCHTIDIVQRKIGDRIFDIVCDDEGALCESPIVSAIGKDCRVMLVGNLFVCNHYKEHLTSLSDDDAAYIVGKTMVASYAKPTERVFHTNPILTDVSYVRV